MAVGCVARYLTYCPPVCESMNEDKFFEIECLGCGRIGLLTNGLCRHNCGTVHQVVIQ